MKPTRTTQPYRKGSREQGATLQAMLRGKPAHMMHPMEMHRKTRKKKRKRDLYGMLVRQARNTSRR